ncbi:MAG TPA: bifunctional diguanylate cyclase/phosphodiesterase [Kineosporiaceae bacterium]
MTQAPRQPQGSPLRAVTGLVAGLTLASAAVVVRVALADRVRGAILGMALAGVVALVSGAGIVGCSIRRRRYGGAGEKARVLIGVAVVIWGVGQFLLSLQVTSTGQRTFGVGDIVSSSSTPVLVLAVVTLPRRSRTSRPALRLSLDALIVTMSVTLALWWAVLQPALPDPAHPSGQAASGAVMAMFDVGCAALTLMVWARDRRQGAAFAAIALVIQAIADICSLPAVISDRPLPWVSGVLWCVAWPLLAAGVSGYATSSPAHDSLLEDLGESRATMIATVVSLLLLSGATAFVPHRGSWVGLALAFAAVLLLVVREIVNTLIRNRMVRWIADEALRDVLTGLPNRSGLTARIRAVDLSRPWVLLTLDLDGFKEVNDLLGPEGGDDLIVAVAAGLQELCRPPCVLARMGGDEFAVLAPGSVEDGERLAVLLGAAVGEVAAARPGAICLTAGVGVGRVHRDGAHRTGVAVPGTDRDPASADDHHGRLGALVESAAALRAAKEVGRGRIALYPGAVERARERRLRVERRLRTAVASGGLQMHAQPLIDLASGRVVGFESLVRWVDEVLGQVSPAEFVPVAEQTGLVAALGEFALRETLLQARVGGVVGTPVHLGVNVSPIQLRDPAFVPMVLDLIAQSGVHPERLMLEVTEAVLVAGDDPAFRALAALSGAGIPLAIDDFGTGYSALGYLRRIPVDVLKVDRSWVVAAVADQRTRDIVAGVVTLAHRLGARVVMEGVEDDATAQMCRDVRADVGQGWLFGRPRPWPVAAAELLAEPLRYPPAPRPSGDVAVESAALREPGGSA